MKQNGSSASKRMTPGVHTAQPGGVRNSQPVWNVSTPWPKCEVTKCCARGSCERTWIALWSTPPYQAASKANGSAISQPLALAIESGMQRYAKCSDVASIQSRSDLAGTSGGGSGQSG